ncbi:MAG: hypothetical protein JXB34_10425 [Bacteroidales bacterium]|nr:hypothetical protein [Bacteroidales bacterium]
MELFLSYNHTAFHLEVRNLTSQKINLWSQKCSGGYYAFYFKVSSMADTKKACFIRRKEIFWTVNIPSVDSVGANKSLTYNFHLHDKTWDLNECRIFKPGEEIKVSCILEIKSDEDTLDMNVLTGVFESNAIDFDSIQRILTHFN